MLFDQPDQLVHKPTRSAGTSVNTIEEDEHRGIPAHCLVVYYIPQQVTGLGRLRITPFLAVRMGSQTPGSPGFGDGLGFPSSDLVDHVSHA